MNERDQEEIKIEEHPPRPLYNQVLVKVIQRGRTPAGLWIPSTAEENIPRAVVIAVGQGTPLDDGSWRPPVVEPGDVVLVQGKGLELDSQERLWFFRDDQLISLIGRLAPVMLDEQATTDKREN